MDRIIKRIRTYAVIALAIVLFQSLAGFTALYTGAFYNDYDEVSANETLGVIRDTDQHYYALLNDPAQPEFMQEFRRLHTKKGNMTLVVTGMMLVFMSGMILIPVTLVLFSTSSDKKSDGDAGEEKKDAAPEEEEDSF